MNRFPKRGIYWRFNNNKLIRYQKSRFFFQNCIVKNYDKHVIYTLSLCTWKVLTKITQVFFFFGGLCEEGDMGFGRN